MSDEEHTIDVLESSYPLLKKLREQCPGTYTHSKNVASLLEALGEEFGLDVRKLKEAGQYHDIGKTSDPKMFFENLVDEKNPHDDLDPIISQKIISAHIGNTTQILINDGNFDIDVIRWCSQHHGDSVIRAFFNKAVAVDENVNEDDFRYKCSRPDSLEAGLLMICDCLEAKVKAMYQKENPPEIKSIVSETFETLMEECQLDDIGLPKLSYIRVIKQVLTRELNSIYQAKRVDYESEE